MSKVCSYFKYISYKYIKETTFENEIILFVEKIFIYNCDVDYILYWWKYYNKNYNV